MNHQLPYLLPMLQCPPFPHQCWCWWRIPVQCANSFLSLICFFVSLPVCLLLPFTILTYALYFVWVFKCTASFQNVWPSNSNIHLELKNHKSTTAAILFFSNVCLIVLLLYLYCMKVSILDALTNSFSFAYGCF